MSYEVLLPNSKPAEIELIVDRTANIQVDYHTATELTSKQCREWTEALMCAAKHLEFQGD